MRRSNPHAAFVASILCCASSLTACIAPSFAPPARLSLGGMPEPLGRGGFEVSAHGLGGGNLSIGGGEGAVIEARAGAGVAPWMDVEIGAGHASARIGGPTYRSQKVRNDTWMGSALVRGYPVRGSTVVALGAGLGVGCGGAIESRSLCALGRVAISGMAELDIGYRGSERWAVYLGNRIQPSYTQGAPHTFWTTHGIGVEVDFPEAFGLFLAPEMGVALGFTTEVTWIVGGGALGIGLRFGGSDEHPR